MRKIAFFLVAILVTASIPAFAEVAPTSMLISAEPVVQDFTVDLAMEYALKNHPSLLSAQSNVTKNIVARDDAQSLYFDRDDKSATTYDLFTIKKGLGLKNAEMTLILSQKGLEQAQASVKFGAESAFYTYLGMADKVKSATESYDLAKNKLEDIQKKKEVGLVSDFDILTVNTMVKQAKFSLDKATRDMENAEFDFKSAIGLLSNSKVTISGLLELPNQPEMKLEDAINKARENRLEAITASQNYLISKESFGINGLWYEEKTYKYKEAQYAVDVSYYNLYNTLNSVEISVRKAYSNVQNAFESLDVLNSNYEVDKTNYEITQKKFELGLATSIDVSDAFQKLSDIKISKSDAVLACILAVRQYELSYSIGVAK